MDTFGIFQVIFVYSSLIDMWLNNLMILKYLIYKTLLWKVTLMTKPVDMINSAKSAVTHKRTVLAGSNGMVVGFGAGLFILFRF